MKFASGWYKIAARAAQRAADLTSRSISSLCCWVQCDVLLLNTDQTTRGFDFSTIGENDGCAASEGDVDATITSGCQPTTSSLS